MASGSGRPGFMVFRELTGGRWLLIGEVNRRPGLTARAARLRAIEDATSGKAKTGERYHVILRSEWRVGAEEIS